MKTKRIFTSVSFAVFAVLCLSCERIESGNDWPSSDGNMFFYIKSEAPQTKSTARTSISYIPLYNEDGTENNEFVLECVSVPMGEFGNESGTKTALYGSGVKQNSSREQVTGDCVYYDYKKPVVLSAKCTDTKAGKQYDVYTQKHIGYDEDLDLWIPGDGRIWRDSERYEFRAHIPEALTGVEIESFGSDLEFDFTIPEVAMNQQDIMFGYYSGDKTRQEKGYKIADIPFKHALASVRFMVYLANNGNLNVRKISLGNVYQKGRCTQTNGGNFSWQPLTEYDMPADDIYGEAAKTTIYGESMYYDGYALEPGNYTFLGYEFKEGEYGYEGPEGNDMVFAVMPQKLSDENVTVSLECYSNGEVVTLRATIASGEWKPGYTTIYRMTPNVACGTVDLGLSVIWGDKNLGAFRQYESGWIFRWGETTIFNNSSNTPYPHFDEDGNPTKYNGSDGLTVLQPEDDAATYYCGEPWRMPTIDECMELGNSDWLTKLGSGMMINNLFISKLTGYEGNKIVIVEAQERNCSSSSIGHDDSVITGDNVYKYASLNYGWIGGSAPDEWIYVDGARINYSHLATIQSINTDRTATHVVRPVIPVLIFDDYKTVRPNNIITASAGSTVSFSLAEEYAAQSWTAEADGTEFDSGTGSDSVTVPFGANQVVIKRDTGVVIGTINVQ